MTETLPVQTDSPSARERRHAAILDAAESLFIEQGYERTSLAEIVRQSGGSLATLYDLFGNKQGLLHALAARWLDEAMAARMGRAGDSPMSNRDILMSYVGTECEMQRSPRAIALMRMLVSESLRDRDFALQTYRNLHLPAIRELADLFTRWTADGDATVDDPEGAAHLFFSIISGDSMLGILAGVEDGVLDGAQIVWRLQPFFAHFGIR